jgi:hypothetical protein
MKKYFFTILIACLSSKVFTQTAEQIKSDTKTYLWGEGTGATLSAADQDALMQIISQLSATVEANFTLIKDEAIKNGKSNFTETSNLLMSTYSNATLTNTERIVLSDEPNARVLRYLRRSEIDRVFQQRKQKIIDFTLLADGYAQQAQIADALKYYYWAYLLLRSHPYGAEIEVPHQGTASKLLATYLPMRIDELMSGLNYQVTDIAEEPEYKQVTLYITYNGKPVANLDYSYWDGRDWSQPVSAKDGVGYLEFFGQGVKLRTDTRIRVEYAFEYEARIDRELESVMQKLTPLTFRNSHANIALVKSEKPTITPNPVNSAVTTRMLSPVENPKPYEDAVRKVIAAISSDQSGKVQSLFTPEGFDIYTKLLAYGKARILGEQTFTPIRFGNEVICRGPKMSFAFANNSRKFVEDVVFHFNEQGKISSIAFGLSAEAIHSITQNPKWTETEKLTIINFLEHYKTAYALKRLDYISSIFSDDALIIVGNVVKVNRNTDNPFGQSKIVKYNRYSKQQYIKNLQQAFASSEFINIQFEDSDLRKAGTNSNRFGIQIKQNYFSSNYADQGYLFLLIDFTAQDSPVIHVRTWQPEKNPDGSIYGLEDF